MKVFFLKVKVIDGLKTTIAYFENELTKTKLESLDHSYSLKKTFHNEL